MSRPRSRTKTPGRPLSVSPDEPGHRAAGSALWITPAVVFAYTLIVFVPATDNGFVNWDDPQNILDNDGFRGLGPAQLKWMFTTKLLGVYQPLSWLALGVQYRVWELKPAGYHAVSAVVHAAGAAIFFFVALQVLRLVFPGVSGGPAPSGWRVSLCAGFAAAVYAVHPLRAEPAAWVSCQPYVLAMFFYLLALACYLRARGGPGPLRASRAWYAAAVAAYAASVLCKAIGVTLPAVLLLLDVYPLRRVGGSAGWSGARLRRVLVDKIPFVLLAVAAAAAGSIATAAHAPMAQALAPLDRAALAAFGLAFYVWKTIAPVGLSPYYQLPVPFDRFAWYFVLSAVAVVVVTVAVIALRRRFPGGLAACAYYVIVLVPVVGIVQHGSQIAADRYSYLSCLSWPILTAGLLMWFSRIPPSGIGRQGRARFVTACIAAAPLVGALSYLTQGQVRVWHDSEALWRQALAVNPRCHFAHNNLGLLLTQRGDREGAIRHYRRAVEIEPANVWAQRNLGLALQAVGKSDEAVEHLRVALDYRPDYAKAHHSLGRVLAARGELDRAVHHLEEAIRLAPDTIEAYINLANIYLQEPGQPRLDEAMKVWRAGLSVAPTHAGIRGNLATALALRRRYAEAVEVLEAGLTYAPADPGLARRLAWLLATCPGDALRDGPRAVRLAESAVYSSSKQDPQALNALAAAYAEVGRFTDAVRTAASAAQAARKLGQEQLAREIAAFLAEYRAGQPHRLP